MYCTAMFDFPRGIQYTTSDTYLTSRIALQLHGSRNPPFYKIQGETLWIQIDYWFCPRHFWTE